MSPPELVLVILCFICGAGVSLTVGFCLWCRRWPAAKSGGLAALFAPLFGGSGRVGIADSGSCEEQLTAMSNSQELFPESGGSVSGSGGYRTFSPSAPPMLLSRLRIASDSCAVTSAEDRESKGTAGVRKLFQLAGSRRQSSESLLQTTAAPIPESVSEGAVDYLRRRRASSFSDLRLQRPAATDAASTLAELGLDLSLYVAPECPEEEAEHETSLGRLGLKLELVMGKSTLLVTVVRAKYLLRRRPSNLCLFYVTLAYSRPTSDGGGGGGDAGGCREKHRTQLVSAACNPQFDRLFALQCGSAEEAAGSLLLFKVKEKMPVGKSQVIGSCEFPIAALLEMGPGGHEVWRELQSVSLTTEDDAPKPGKIFLALSYNQPKKLLSLGIVECRDLKIKDTDAYVYFRASVMARERTMKAKKGPLIKESLANPSVQQEFNFHLAQHLTDQVYLFVLICARSRLGANRLLGKAVVGSVNFAQGTGVEQWTDCFRNQPSIVYQWHDVY